jgi:hypothetical protein
MFSWQFLVDLVELQHITLKMLDTNAKDSEGKIKILTKRKVVNKDDTANKGGETPDGESEVRFLRVHSCGGDAACVCQVFTSFLFSGSCFLGEILSAAVSCTAYQHKHRKATHEIPAKNVYFSSSNTNIYISPGHQQNIAEIQLHRDEKRHAKHPHDPQPPPYLSHYFSGCGGEGPESPGRTNAR